MRYFLRGMQSRFHIEHTFFFCVFSFLSVAGEGGIEDLPTPPPYLHFPSLGSQSLMAQIVKGLGVWLRQASFPAQSVTVYSLSFF